MALRGWRLFGVAGTIFAYVIGILILSIVSVQNPQPRRARSHAYGESDPFQNRVLGLLGKRQPLQWCRELRYLNHEPPQTLAKPKTFTLLQTFPGHYVKAKAILKSSSDDEEVHIVPESILPPPLSKRRNASSSNHLAPFNLGNAKPPPKGLTALASFPGSGNTWLRYLLQQATGIYTGSVYKDYGLLKSGFPAENIFNSSVLVVKTHEWGPRAWTMFSKVILLVRDPDKAILAEFNRQSGGHVGFASPDRYKRTKGRYWQHFVANKLNDWEQMNLSWAKNFTGEIKIVFYDDLVGNVEQVLRDVLIFIRRPIDEALLNCALIRKEGIYRRKKRLMTFDPYSPLMHRMLEDKRDEVYTLLGRPQHRKD